jgi:hypothetical protein
MLIEFELQTIENDFAEFVRGKIFEYVCCSTDDGRTSSLKVLLKRVLISRRS